MKNSGSYWNEQKWKVWIVIVSRWSVLLPPCTKAKFWKICLLYHLFWQSVDLSGSEAVELAVTARLTSWDLSSWVSIYLGWGCEMWYVTGNKELEVVCSWELVVWTCCAQLKRRMNAYPQKSLELLKECKVYCEVCIFCRFKKTGRYMLETGKQTHFWLLCWFLSRVGIFSTWLLKYLGKVFCNIAEKCSSSAPSVWLQQKAAL